MFTVILVVALFLPKAEKPITYHEAMTSMAECNSAVREMTFRAPEELKNGGQLQVSCVIDVPPSENP